MPINEIFQARDDEHPYTDPRGFNDGCVVPSVNRSGSIADWKEGDIRFGYLPEKVIVHSAVRDERNRLIGTQQVVKERRMRPATVLDQHMGRPAGEQEGEKEMQGKTGPFRKVGADRQSDLVRSAVPPQQPPPQQPPQTRAADPELAEMKAQMQQIMLMLGGLNVTRTAPAESEEVYSGEFEEGAAPDNAGQGLRDVGLDEPPRGLLEGILQKVQPEADKEEDLFGDDFGEDVPPEPAAGALQHTLVEYVEPDGEISQFDIPVVEIGTCDNMFAVQLSFDLRDIPFQNGDWAFHWKDEVYRGRYRGHRFQLGNVVFDLFRMND
jgi:hypothetical protein